MTENIISIPVSAKPKGKASFVMLGTGFDEIEALAPVDVMRRAGMDVFTVSMTDNRLVKGATGNSVVADMCVSDLDPGQIDWLIFPGADSEEAAVNLSDSLMMLVKEHWNCGGNIGTCTWTARDYQRNKSYRLSVSERRIQESRRYLFRRAGSRH